MTSAQVNTVAQIFAPYYGVDGSLIFPRMQPGSELDDAFIYYTGQPFPYTVDWYRYAILEDPTWEATELDVQYAAIASAKDPGGIATWKGDLSAYKNKGGKLLHYHGQVSLECLSTRLVLVHVLTEALPTSGRSHHHLGELASLLRPCRQHHGPALQRAR